MSAGWRLLGDVGGTNVRFGRSQSDGSLVGCQSWPVDVCDGFEQALGRYLSLVPPNLHFRSAAVAGAGRATADAIAITNTDWCITRDGVRRVLGDAVPVRLLNDLEAVALALPFLGEREVRWLDVVRAPPERCGRMLAVNVGTGFGSACVIDGAGGLSCCPAESGHMLLGAQSTQELDLFSAGGLSRPTIEDALSGDGIQWLHRAVALAGGEASDISGARPCGFRFENTDAVALETRRWFGDFLARAVSDLTLAAAAWDGVFLTGSVATAWAAHADVGRFRAEFTGDGKMQHMLAQVPLGVIAHEWPAFLGMAHLEIA